MSLKSMIRACALGLVLLVIPLSPTRASDDTITLMLGSGSTLTLDRPFETVLIDDPDVVDVHPVSDRSVLIEPLNLGSSTIVFVDGRSIAVENVKVVVLGARS